jgi:disulfide oxidoreductase YuzD
MQTFAQFINETPSFSAFLISRVSMPQIRNVSDFGQFLDQLGVSGTYTEIDPQNYNPTQTDFDQSKVDRLIAAEDQETTPIIVSEDNFVADGHHRFYAALQSSSTVQALIVNLPINKLLKLMYDYTELRNG